MLELSFDSFSGVGVHPAIHEFQMITAKTVSLKQLRKVHLCRPVLGEDNDALFVPDPLVTYRSGTTRFFHPLNEPFSFRVGSMPVEFSPCRHLIQQIQLLCCGRARNSRRRCKCFFFCGCSRDVVVEVLVEFVEQGDNVAMI